jgi:hypothetical protein
MLEGTPGTEAHLAVHTDAARRRPRPRTTTETRRRDVVAWLSALSLAGVGRPRAADPDAEAEATAVARAWLDCIDQGRYAVGLTAAASALRQAVGEEDWEVALRSVRTSLGQCHSRALHSRTTLEALPGLPPGPYTVIRFESGFDRRPGVTETVTTHLGDDGRWRVAAYFIR